MNRLESLTEKRLREAIENGELDDLPGKGEPLDLRENPFEDPDLRMVHRLLRNAGFAPAWIEERKDVDATFEAAREQLERAWNLYGKNFDQDVNWQRNVLEFREKVAELNQRLRVYNLKVPAVVFQRNLIDVEKEIGKITLEKS